MLDLLQVKVFLLFGLASWPVYWLITWRKNNGVKTKYYRNKTKKSEIKLSKGKLQGLSVIYYQNGNIKEKINFCEGKMIGLRTKYHQTGEVDTNLLGNEKTLSLKDLYNYIENGDEE